MSKDFITIKYTDGSAEVINWTEVVAEQKKLEAMADQFVKDLFGETFSWNDTMKGIDEL